jgi:hypothetical protein
VDKGVEGEIMNRGVEIERPVKIQNALGGETKSMIILPF